MIRFVEFVSLELQDRVKVSHVVGKVRSFTAKVRVPSHRPQNT